MRGNQLAREWRIIRAKEASPNGLTETEIAQREETRIRAIYHGLGALQAAGSPLYTERFDRANRSAFVDAFKFETPPLIISAEQMSHRAFDLIRDPELFDVGLLCLRMILHNLPRKGQSSVDGLLVRPKLRVKDQNDSARISST